MTHFRISARMPYSSDTTCEFGVEPYGGHLGPKVFVTLDYPLLEGRESLLVWLSRDEALVLAKALEVSAQRALSEAGKEEGC